MKKLGLYAALALFVPSVMAKEIAVPSIAVVIAEAGANTQWLIDSLEGAHQAVSMHQLENQLDGMILEVNRDLEKQIAAKLEKQFASRD